MCRSCRVRRPGAGNPAQPRDVDTIHGNRLGHVLRRDHARSKFSVEQDRIGQPGSRANPHSQPSTESQVDRIARPEHPNAGKGGSASGSVLLTAG